jgi:hypothetical protein
VRLPNAEDAIVERDKVANYLLSGTHTRGRDKAHFFVSFGFSPHAPDELQRALLLPAKANDVISA